MRKALILMIALLLAMMTSIYGGALAEVVADSYTDTPANPTQDNVTEIRAVQTVPGADPEEYIILTMEPTAATVWLLGELYDFVDINQVPPVRWFPEEIQQDIRKLLDGGDPDALYIPEIFSALPQRTEQAGDVDVDMLMNIDYAPGALIVVVLGVETETGVDWFALKGDVPVDDTIHFEIPAEVNAQLAGHETLTVVFTVKPGEGWQKEESFLRPEPTFVPSKSGSNMTYVEDKVTISGTGDPSDCRILIVPQTETTRQELARFTDWMTKKGKAPLDYFDDKILSEISLLLADTDLGTLLPYEVECVMVENYKEPYGDVMARFRFPSEFDAGKKTVTLLGMPQADGSFVWTVLYTQINDPHTEITFSSTVLPAMMAQPGLMLVFSEPIAE